MKRIKRMVQGVLMMMGVLLGSWCCTEDTNGNMQGFLIISGTYNDDWGGHHEITQEVWVQSGFGEESRFFITGYSNEDHWLVARNGSQNSWNPDLFSRFDWTWFTDDDGKSLWFCHTIFDAETEDDAFHADPADATDPSVGGCGDFSWTKLIPEGE